MIYDALNCYLINENAFEHMQCMSVYIRSSSPGISMLTIVPEVFQKQIFNCRFEKFKIKFMEIIIKGKNRGFIVKNTRQWGQGLEYHTEKDIIKFNILNNVYKTCLWNVFWAHRMHQMHRVWILTQFRVFPSTAK